MSDVDRRKENIAEKFFGRPYQINNSKKQHIANVFVAKTDRMAGPLGTFYTVHGYGGSPVEFCLKTPTELALENGFNVIALESIQLSATDGTPKSLSEMTLNNHRAAVFNALMHTVFTKEIKKTDFNVATAHSMGARSICDLSMSSNFIRKYFDKRYALNSFFLPPKRLQKAYSKPEVWSRMCTIPQTEDRIIEGNTYTVPTCTNNYYVDLPKDFGACVADVEKITELVSYSLMNSHVAFVLGENDLPNYDNYKLNSTIYNNLTIPDKELFIVPGANHYFENEKVQFYKTFENIITSLRDKRMKVDRR